MERNINTANYSIFAGHTFSGYVIKTINDHEQSSDIVALKYTMIVISMRLLSNISN